MTDPWDERSIYGFMIWLISYEINYIVGKYTIIPWKRPGVGDATYGGSMMPAMEEENHELEECL